MSVFRYLSEADSDEEPLTIGIIQEMTGMDVTRLIKLFIEYMKKYPELLEFPNGIQNLQTLFYEEIQYDLPLIKSLCETFVDNFNIIMSKD